MILFNPYYNQWFCYFLQNVFHCCLKAFFHPVYKSVDVMAQFKLGFEPTALSRLNKAWHSATTCLDFKILIYYKFEALHMNSCAIHFGSFLRAHACSLLIAYLGPVFFKNKVSFLVLIEIKLQVMTAEPYSRCWFR